MSFNILTDPLFPVRTRSGAQSWLAFADLARMEGDLPIAFDWPRPDLNIAAFELAIGIATLAFGLLDEDAWRKLWLDPPSPAETNTALCPLKYAFALDGEGPRFLQALEPVTGKILPIEGLLIDTPGANGQKKNADVLTHRGRYGALGPAAAATALYALQQFAPSGGAGNRTSMRGGGPMTTLVLPSGDSAAPMPLWRAILANLTPEGGHTFEPEADLPRILPWLAPTLLSDKANGERVIHEGGEDAHPLQAHFGMPRRIRLSFCDGVCAMTGAVGLVAIGFAQSPWGANYGLWRHPLTPYRRQKAGGEPYSVKPKSTRSGYVNWVAATVGGREGQLSEPSKAVQVARRARLSLLRGPGGEDPHLLIGGWAMNNMEAIAYLAATQPLHLARSDLQQQELDERALSFALAADIIAEQLRYALRTAHFGEGTKPATDVGVFDEAITDFYDATEPQFHNALNGLLEVIPLDGVLVGDTHQRAWLRVLAVAARVAFDRHAQMRAGDHKKAERVAHAFGTLNAALSGRGKAGKALFKRLRLLLPADKPRAA